MSTNDNPFGTPSEEADEVFDTGDMGEDTGFRIAKGKHPAKLIGLDRSTSQAGNPMWVFTFVIVAGPAAGKEMKVWCALTAAAMWKLRETLEGLGLAGDGKSSKFSKKDALGKLVTLDVEDDTYKGRPSSKVEKVLPISEEDLKKALAAAKALEASKSDNPLDAPTSDEIPF